MKTTFKLYSPTKEHTNPIKIKVDKDELRQIVVGLYRKIDTHPVSKFMKGGK